MHKTQLYMEESQYLILKDWAQKQKKSIAQLVREIIDSALKPSPKESRDSLYDLVGAADSGRVNISENADDYLYGDEQTIERLEQAGVVRDAPRRRKKK